MTTTDVRTDRWRWVADPDPRWDPDRERVFAAIPDRVFPTMPRRPGARLPGDWWRVEDEHGVVGYGWLDDVWGDAEILLAVEQGVRGSGAGAFTLARLEEEAVARGLNYVLNVVRDTHPEREGVTAWLLARGFTADEGGRLRKRVGDRTRDVGQRQAGRPGTGTAPLPDGGRQERYAAERDRAAGRGHPDDRTGGSDLGPGTEESGGYVAQEQHRF
ncbi:GNAT family N-acetyltransferase [Geodermatophilus sabuli]|uniref:GNAT family N-acetyltransferase n=1 Tax=Geodermatophilus sabuli TaxID=1564158 RepID=A0A7K3VUH6_9ACTN|nr:GNAT family N-acetyltransferase [Geodermatophilus sabuli]NEK56305.1 GNAT family N-acetyltransferase [Geodermatophilus sabuli]